MKRVLFLVRHYPPDVGAPSYRAEHAAQVLANDFEVRVLAAQPNRYGDDSVAPRHEVRQGVQIHRAWHGRLFRSRGKLARGVTELIGAVWMTIIAALRYRDSDAVLVSTPPLLYSLPGWALHKLFGVPLIVDLRDLWLDWAEESGVIRSGFLLSLLRRYEQSLIRSARHISVTTRSFKQITSRRFRVDPGRITVIYNGLDEVVQGDGANVRQTAGDKKDDVRRVLYAGNMGPSQNLLGIVDGCLKGVRQWPNLEILLVGDGMQWPELKARQTDRLRVLPYVDRDELKALYETSDAFLLHLAALNVYKHTVPSKVFEYAAYQKPILCGVAGEARELCRQYAPCYEFRSDDPSSLVKALDRFMRSENPDNFGAQRADLRTVLRAARDPLWKQIFAELRRPGESPKRNARETAAPGDSVNAKRG